MSDQILTHDVIIIGGGPAGLAVANTLQSAGLDAVVLEKGSIADHISQYPTFMEFFSTRDLLEIDGFPLTITEEKPSRRQYLNYLTRFAKDRALNVQLHTRVTSVQRRGDGTFTVEATRTGENPTVSQARAVVVACGAFNNPRLLGVPGEELPKVTHFFKESHPYVGNKVLIVGGRNSAIETALHLWRAGAEVSISYHRTEFRGHGIKYWLKPDIDNRIKNGEIKAWLGTRVERIDWRTVILSEASGRRFEIENDYVICHTGFDPPAQFLRSMGMELEPETNVPKHDSATLETNVPGLYVAGTIVAGNVSGHVFIENSRHHGELILAGLRRSAIISVP